jgi:hypothetical protein
MIYIRFVSIVYPLSFLIGEPVFSPRRRGGTEKPPEMVQGFMDSSKHPRAAVERKSAGTHPR